MKELLQGTNYSVSTWFLLTLESRLDSEVSDMCTYNTQLLLDRVKHYLQISSDNHQNNTSFK